MAATAAAPTTRTGAVGSILASESRGYLPKPRETV